MSGARYRRRTEDRSQRSEKDLKAGQRLALGCVRRWMGGAPSKTPGRPSDSLNPRAIPRSWHLYKDRFLSSLVLPFSPAWPSQRHHHARLQGGRSLCCDRCPPPRADSSEVGRNCSRLRPPAAGTVKTEGAPDAEAGSAALISAEPVIRKQERQATIGEFSAFLATENPRTAGLNSAQPGRSHRRRHSRFRPADACRERHATSFASRRFSIDPRLLPNHWTSIADSAASPKWSKMPSPWSPRNWKPPVSKSSRSTPASLAPVRTDEAKMQQVFLSIFKNAIEAMTPGGIIDDHHE